jgi:hypothetical protein
MNIEIFEFLEDIANALPLEAEYSWVVISVACLSMLGVVVALYFAFNTAPPLTPAQVLAASITKMQRDGQGLLCPPRDIYYQFVSALKVFLKHELSINVDSKMDSEIAVIAAKEKLDADLVAELDDILQRAHQVRFAHLTVDPAVVQKDIVWLRKLIAFVSKKKS